MLFSKIKTQVKTKREIVMKVTEHILNFSGSVREHSQSKGPVANRYNNKFNYDPHQKKVSSGKVEPLAIKNSRNLKGATSGASNLSKGVLKEGGRLRIAKATAVVANPLAMGTIVGAVAVGFYGIANIIRYRRNEKSGAQAAKDTITGSAGVGISTGLGVAAANVAVGAFGSMVLAPVAAGAAVAYVSMAVWDKLFYTGKIPSKIG